MTPNESMKHEFLGIIIYATLAALPIYGGILLLREISADPESTEHTLIPPQYRLLGVGGGNSPQTPSQTNSAGSGLPPKSSLRLFAEVFIYIALILLIILIADRVGGGAYAPPDPHSGGGGGDIGAESESAGLLGGLFGGSTRGSGGTSVPPWRTSRHIPIAHILFILFVADGKVGEALRFGGKNSPQTPLSRKDTGGGGNGRGNGPPDATPIHQLRPPSNLEGDIRANPQSVGPGQQPNFNDMYSGFDTDQMGAHPGVEAFDGW